MKRAYLMVYATELGDREKVKAILNQMTTVDKWRYDLPSSCYIVSSSTARQIAEEFRKLSGNLGRLIVTEIPENSYGWLTAGSWHLIQNLEFKA